MMDKYCVKNGVILDVLDGSRTCTDILVEGGVVTKLSPEMAVSEGEILDAGGMMITTGWVDDHAHIYWGTENHIGISPERYLLPFGVTYAIDPGTSGSEDYSDFRRRVKAGTNLRFRSYLNIAVTGTPVRGYELTDMKHLNGEACRETFQKYRDEFVGIKARITSSMCADPLKTLQEARRLADELDTNLCIHATRCDLKTETILSFLGKGDVLTHCYAETESGILDAEGNVKKCVREARDRGVLFDVGHGLNSFTFAVAEKAIAQGFLADSLSTDLHIADVNGPVFDMPTTISKFLALGLDLNEVLRMVTVNPVRNLGLSDKSLRIQEGEPADFTVFSLEEGRFSFTDCKKEVRIHPTRVASHFTCLGKNIYYPIHSREENRKMGAAAL